MRFATYTAKGATYFGAITDDDPIYGNIASTHDDENALGLLPNVSRTDCNDYYCFVGEMDRAQCNDYMQDAADGEFLVRQNKVMTLK